MNHKNPIDLSQAHLIPWAIKKYALDIWDTIQKYPVANPEKQRLHLLLSKAESILAADAMTSKYFEKTREAPNKLNGLKALVNHEPDWRGKRRGSVQGERYNTQEDIVLKYQNFPYPFFLTYYFDNNLDHPINVLKKLIGTEADKLPDGFDFLFEDIVKEQSMPSVFQGIIRSDFFHFSSGWEIGNAISSANRYQLFNHDLLQDYEDRTLRPVFLVESFKAANQLELEIKKGNTEYLWTELQKTLHFAGHQNERSSLSRIENAYDGVQIHLFDLQQKLKLTEKDCLAIFSESMKYVNYESSPTSGDAVVTAAVGGYSIPEYTDWSLLGGRDIYIFKFGERRPEKFLAELLNITACIVRDLDEDIISRIKYVVMSDKRGIEVKDNDIKYWSSAELFAEAKLYNCPIPEELASTFDLFCRKSSPSRTNPYVIEPFLRRNSWMLLSGEEGTGKSYMAMALSAAIATGGKLFLNWKIRQRKSTVMYVADSEMTDDIIRERMTVLNRLYKGCTEKLIIESVKNLNLLDRGCEYIEKCILRESSENRCVEILVLDHLLKLTNAHGDEEEYWPKIRQWIEQLNDRGITVILLHHEFAGSRMLGTRLIAADAPARLHLDVVEQPDDNQTINFGVAIVKNRGGKLKRKVTAISFNIGKSPRWITTTDTEAGKDNQNFRKMSREERREKVLELRDSMSNREIAKKLGCSLSSIEKIVQDLPEEKKKIKRL